MKVLIIFVAFVEFSFSNPVLVNSKVYYTKVFKSIAEQILENPSWVLKLADFEDYFYTQALDKTWNGTVKFHSGFVNRIKKFHLPYLPPGDKITSDELSMSRTLEFADFKISFNMDCDSEEYTTPSVVVFTFASLQIDVRIFQNPFDKISKAEATSRLVGSFSAQGFPDNAYTQIIAKEISQSSGSTPLKAKLIESLNGWTAVLQTLFEKALLQYGFPEFCHFCPTPP